MTKLSAIVLFTAIPALADTKIVAKYTADGQTTETTISAKGERIRYDYGKNESLVRQCDLGRIVQIDGAAKTYQSLPATPDAARAAMKTEVVDTNERKQMFGYEARHLKIIETADDTRERTETDGWYVELKGLPSCYGSRPQGYPMAYKITSFAANGHPDSTVTMQVTDFSATTLEPALFDVPKDYKDSAHVDTVKPAGATRVGTVAIRDRSTHKIATAASLSRLRSQIQEAKINVIGLEDGTADAIEAKAAEAHCDYILYTELVSLEKPDTGRVGGLLHKTPIVGRATDGDAFEAKLEYRLVPAGGPMPAATAISARTGHAINWIGAATLAANFTPMGMAMKSLGGAGMFNPMMINALMKGGGMGAAMASTDPLMGSMSMFLRGMNPSADTGKNAPGMDAAVAAAVEQEAAAVIAKLKK